MNLKRINTNLMDKAREYALQVLDNQIKLVEDAYNRGYADALKTIVSEPIPDGYDTFLDLGLDSGLLWTRTPHHRSSNYFAELGYYEALKIGIPTLEQFEEMISRCKVFKKDREYRGPSSKGIYYGFLSERHIWLKSDVVNDEATAVKFGEDGSYEIKKAFVGSKFYCLRVKEKE